MKEAREKARLNVSFHRWRQRLQRSREDHVEVEAAEETSKSERIQSMGGSDDQACQRIFTSGTADKRAAVTRIVSSDQVATLFNSLFRTFRSKIKARETDKDHDIHADGFIMANLRQSTRGHGSLASLDEVSDGEEEPMLSDVKPEDNEDVVEDEVEDAAETLGDSLATLAIAKDSLATLVIAKETPSDHDAEVDSPNHK
jgi:hypothetical protein